jgi:hypothetical protein
MKTKRRHKPVYDSETLKSFVLLDEDQQLDVSLPSRSRKEQCMDVSESLSGNYLAATDVSNPVVATIRAASREVVGQGAQAQTKLVLQLNELKPVVLNKTNLRALVELYGTNAELWQGQAIEVYRDTTFFQGRQVACLRLRKPSPDTPLAGSVPAQLQPAPVAPAAVAQPQAAPAVQQQQPVPAAPAQPASPTAPATGQAQPQP